MRNKKLKKLRKLATGESTSYVRTNEGVKVVGYFYDRMHLRHPRMQKVCTLVLNPNCARAKYKKLKQGEK